MEITFELIDGLYTAEFEVKSNCNIHVEREGKGPFFILQRGTKTGKYAVVSEEDYNKLTIDVDMLGNIYPKYIKITSVSKPTYAEVNFAEEDGGSGNGGSIEYYKIDENFLSSINEGNESAFAMFPSLVKANTSSIGILIASLTMFNMMNTEITITEILTSSQGIAVFTDVKIVYDSMILTFNDFIEIAGLDNSKWQKITKEEFYNLEV